jgi:hypothetical protein
VLDVEVLNRSNGSLPPQYFYCILHCNECCAVIFEPHTVICKHSNDAVTSHKAIETNGNDGMTASACGVILAVRTVWCKQ